MYRWELKKYRRRNKQAENSLMKRLDVLRMKERNRRIYVNRMIGYEKYILYLEENND